MKVIVEDFRANVNELLLRRGISRTELARRMGVKQPFVSQLLNGQREPGLRVLERMAAALDVQPATLIKKNSDVVPNSA
jgi:transcriptional regulator with XRE-family HTH domain